MSASRTIASTILLLATLNFPIFQVFFPFILLLLIWPANVGIMIFFLLFLEISDFEAGWLILSVLVLWF